MKNKVFYIVIVLSLLIVSCKKSKIDRVQEIFQSYKGKYVIVVEKSTFSLAVFNRKLKKIREYKIAYGKNPEGTTKLFKGDNKTPEGLYNIIEILSMDADRQSSSYKKLKRMNGVLFSAKNGHSKFGYPKRSLGKNVYGARYFLLDFPNRKDILNYKSSLFQGKIPKKRGEYLPIGSGIAIHGNNDFASIGHLASGGCIRMYNRDIVELNRFITIGIPVLILQK